MVVTKLSSRPETRRSVKANGRYADPGVDLVAGGPGTTVVAPFDGVVIGNPTAKTVTLQPNSFFLRNVEVILHHVRPMPNVTAGGTGGPVVCVFFFCLRPYGCT